MNRYPKIIFAILLVAIFLRFFGLADRDTLGDEANYGFRSIGLLDYDNEPVHHSTPIEWFDGYQPQWLNYSFHDAPPLFFYIQHSSFQWFGDTRFALRFPSAVFGVLSVLLVILIGSRLYNTSVGIIAGALSAISVSAIYISRVGIIESTLIFFLLLTNWLFLLAQKRHWLFIWMGISLGLSLLTKYTAVIFIPILFTYMLVYFRQGFRVWQFWVGLCIALCMQTPVILYNYHLYQHFGHFDYALMNLFGEPPEVWQSNPGREIGSVGERVFSYIPQLFFTHFWVMVIVFLISIIAMIRSILRGGGESRKKHAYIITTYIFFTVFIIILGPAPRFLSMVGPYMRLIIAFYLYQLWRDAEGKYKSMVIVASAFLFLASLCYSINSFILPHPIGSWKLAYGAVVRNSFKWGYAELGDYLRAELYHKRPAYTLKPHYTFLKSILSDRKELTEERGYTPYAAMIIYDQNIARMPEHWIFDRLHIYKGWPVFTVEDYQQMIMQNGIAKIADMQAVFYFIIPFDDVQMKNSTRKTDAGLKFEETLVKQGISPIYIKTFDNYYSFRVYKWSDTVLTPSMP